MKNHELNKKDFEWPLVFVNSIAGHFTSSGAAKSLEHRHKIYEDGYSDSVFIVGNHGSDVLITASLEEAIEKYNGI